MSRDKLVSHKPTSCCVLYISSLVVKQFPQMPPGTRANNEHANNLPQIPAGFCAHAGNKDQRDAPAFFTKTHCDVVKIKAFV